MYEWDDEIQRDIEDYAEQQDNKAYVIKCDDCKQTIGKTNSLQESAAGGQCASCLQPKKRKGRQ